MMKHFIIMLGFLLCGAGISFGQEHQAIPRQVFTMVEQQPEFPGGQAALHKFIAGNIRYPRKAFKNDIQGKVIVRFIVETDGSISTPEIVRSLDAGCDKETLRVIQKMPKWNPGRQNGAAVAVYYTLPVTFSLH